MTNNFKDENQLQAYVIKWVKKNYPDLRFRTDWFAGRHCPPYIKEQFNNAQSGPGYPDMHFIKQTGRYSSLYIETKLTTPFKKDGITLLYNQHLWEQYEYIQYLRNEGCAAIFGVGEAAIKIAIMEYMKGNEVDQPIIAVPYIDKHRAASDKAAAEFQRKYDEENPDFMGTPFG